MTERQQNLSSSNSEKYGVLNKNLGRRVFHHSLALAVGRNLSAVGRLVNASLVIRLMGASVFGEYALIGVWLAITEWILDFGTTEVFVREVNQDPRRRSRLIATILALKTIQTPLALVLLFTGLLVMGYSRRIFEAGMIGGLSLIAFSGVLVYRAVLKASLTMEQEVIAEFASVLAMLILTPLVYRSGGGILGLMAAYAAARFVFFAGCVILAKGAVRFSIEGATKQELSGVARASLPIGILGLLAVGHAAADVIVLSQLGSLTDVAIYSAALRLTAPVTVALSAIGVSVFPVLALARSTDDFRKTCQRAADTTVLVGCLAVVCLSSGARFFMGLLGPELESGTGALGILAVSCVIVGVSIVIGPALFVVRAPSYLLWTMVAGLVVRIALLVVLTPRFGYLGTASGTLIAEAFQLPLTLFFIRKMTGVTLRLSGILSNVAIGAVVLTFMRFALPQANLLAAVLAGLLYVALARALGLFRIDEVRSMLT